MPAETIKKIGISLNSLYHEKERQRKVSFLMFLISLYNVFNKDSAVYSSKSLSSHMNWTCRFILTAQSFSYPLKEPLSSTNCSYRAFRNLILLVLLYSIFNFVFDCTHLCFQGENNISANLCKLSTNISISSPILNITLTCETNRSERQKVAFFIISKTICHGIP